MLIVIDQISMFLTYLLEFLKKNFFIGSNKKETYLLEPVI